MSEIVEDWSAGEKSIRYSVKLSAGAVVTVPTNRYNPDRRYQVDRLTVQTTWTIGQPDDIDQAVFLYCRAELANGRWSPREGMLHLYQLREIPTWLEDIISRATPRGLG